MSTVTEQDLNDLLNILYQGSVRKHPSAVIPVYSTGAQFFTLEDISTISSDYGLPLPQADLIDVLNTGLKMGLYSKSIQNGTQCGFSVCFPKGASYLAFSSDGSGPGNPNTNRIVNYGTNVSGNPIIIYAYNPNMLKVNSQNRAILAAGSPGPCQGRLCQTSQQITGSYVKYANNRAPFYQYRGSASTSNYPPRSTPALPSSKCCRG